MSAPLARDLRGIAGEDGVICPVQAASPYNADATGPWRGIRGRADAIVMPSSVEQIAELVGFCHERGVPLVPRGGGSGVSGGACPLQGGIVCSLERMREVLEVAAGQWRMRVQAGLSTAHVHRLARESGLIFPPDPGAAEQSQIGGNTATDAGGPHALKYGSTRHWVTGVTAVVPPGEVVALGGSARKDVSAYDLTGLMVGSEGTLGVIAEVQLRLLPAPEAALGVVAFLPSRGAGCEAVQRALASGVVPAALEMIDAAALREVAAAYPGTVPAGAAFALIAEADGQAKEAARQRDALAEAIGEGAIALDMHDRTAEVWRWREGVSAAVAAVRGGKVSEDVVVPVERLEELLARFERVAGEHGLPPCAFGHAGDGNVHATVMVDPSDPAQMQAAERVTEGLFEAVVEMGGSVSAEHGIGTVKRTALAMQLPPAALHLHEAVKRVFDPRGVMNPGKKGPPAGP